ncbi:MAG TPA: hypothetical protein PKX15_01315 [Bacteroidales bacterium]|nr:hypothetical protein [Bacteroidales bacterium]
MRTKLFFLSSLTFFLFIFTSCIKDDLFDFSKVEVDIDSKWAANIVNVEASLNDFDIKTDEDSEFSLENRDNLLVLLFNTTKIYSLRGDTMFRTSLATSNINLVLPSVSGQTKNTKATYNYSIDTSLELSINGMILDSALLKSGVLTMNIATDINHPYEITLKSNNILNSSMVPLSITKSSTSSNVNFTIDIANTYIIFPNQQNIIPITFDVAITPQGGSLNFPYHIDINNSLPSLTFSWLHGQSQKKTEHFSKQLSMSFLENTASLRCMFKTAKINVEVKNNVGMPLSLTLDTLMLCNDIDKYYFDLQPYSNILAANYPKIKGEFATTKEEFDIQNFKYANSNTYIQFTALGILNNDGIDGNKYFITDSARYRIHARVEVPLNIDLYNLTYFDTIDFEMDSIDINVLDYAIFRIEMNNSFSFGLNTQAYFLNESNQIIDSLFTPSLNVGKASLDPNNEYRLLEPTSSVTKIKVENKRLQKIMQAKQILLKADATVNKNDPRVIFYYDEQKLKIKLGIQTQVKTKL